MQYYVVTLTFTFIFFCNSQQNMANEISRGVSTLSMEINLLRRRKTKKEKIVWGMKNVVDLKYIVQLSQ